MTIRKSRMVRILLLVVPLLLLHRQVMLSNDRSVLSSVEKIAEMPAEKASERSRDKSHERNHEKDDTNHEKVNCSHCSFAAQQPHAHHETETADVELISLFSLLWSKFKKAYKKTYVDRIEELQAQKTFFSNLVRISSNQKLYDDGQVAYGQSVNAFSDMSYESTPLLNLKLSISRKRGFDTDAASRYYVLKKLKNRVGFPSEFDWRAYNVETEVRNQGSCGSCWAFAVSGALEGVYAFFNRENVQFSPQELIDCSLRNFGCDGGWIDVAFDYLAEKRSHKWLAAEQTYPYRDTEPSQCQNNSASIVDYYENNPSEYVLSCTVCFKISFSISFFLFSVLLYFHYIF